MLDVETKNRINTARDILVGKVPDPKSQVEQITIALIYKFMDDMDVESEELGGKRTFFVGEYAKYAWRKIFDPRQSGYELLNLYSEAITKMDTNPGVPKLFRDIFKNAYLPYRDPETLKSFLKIINDFEYSHSEKLGDAFEFLLSILGSQGDAGQFRTPRHIIDFMVEIIDPKKHEVILDPACGTAGFLISSYKHIVKQNSSNFLPEKNTVSAGNGTQSVNEVIITTNGYSGDKLTADERRILADNIHGYDISPDMVRLSLVNMYLHGIKEPHISEYDTLTSEDHWNQYCDVILANPPFMSPKGGIRPHKRFSIPSNRSEVLFVDYIAEHLTPDGRAIVIVPEGIIFQSGTAYKNLRKMLVEKYLVGVISLPAGVFNPYSGVKTSILWLDKTLAKKTDKILFVKIENDGFDLGAQRRAIKENDLPKALMILNQYKGNVIETTNKLADEGRLLIIEKEKIAVKGDYNLSVDRYVLNKTLSTDYKTVQLQDISEFSNGLWTGKKSPLQKAKVIRNTNFRKDGFIDWTDIAELDVEQNQFINRELKKGDIILEKSGGGPTQPVGRVVLFDCDIKGFSYSNFTSRIRVRRDDFLPKFLWLMLRDFYSRGKTDKYQKQTSGIRNLDFNLYKEIYIPHPPVSVQNKIVEEIESYQKIIDGARQVVENYKPRIDIDPEWEIVELGDVCELVTGGTPRSTVREYYDGGEIKWLVSGDIHKEEIFDCEGRITELGFKSSNAKYLPINSVLIALNGQGKTRGTVAILRVKATCNQSIVAINPNTKEKLLPEFLYLQLKAKYQEIRNITGDDQRSGLNMPIIRSIKIHLPEISVQKELVREFTEENDIVKNNMVLIERFEQKIKDRIAKVWGE